MNLHNAICKRDNTSSGKIKFSININFLSGSIILASTVFTEVDRKNRLKLKQSYVLCTKCSPSNIRRNETNDQHSFIVQWLIRLPGKQEVHGSILCEGRVLFFCSVLWSYHHVAISVIRTRETIMSELSHNTMNWDQIRGEHRTRFFVLSCFLPSSWRTCRTGQKPKMRPVLQDRTPGPPVLCLALMSTGCPVLLPTFVLAGGRTGQK